MGKGPRVQTWIVNRLKIHANTQGKCTGSLHVHWVRFLLKKGSTAECCGGLSENIHKKSGHSVSSLLLLPTNVAFRLQNLGR